MGEGFGFAGLGVLGGVDLPQPSAQRSSLGVPPFLYLKRGYGWDRTRLDSRQGAAIWCGHGAFARNLVKISTLAS